MVQVLGALERVDVRSAWVTESQSFTPWLASDGGLRLLSSTLGIELELQTTEHRVGPFRADILAKRTDTPDEHWVLIENQLERTDHLHLGQLLTYAAGLKAATIVWVASNFTDEHRAALDWLNEITTEHFEFYGLEVELWKIGNSLPAPKLNLVVRPNDWTRSAKESIGADGGSVSPLKLMQQRYWSALHEVIKLKARTVKPQKALPQHWSNFGIGKSGVWLCASMDTISREISIECQMRGPDGKSWFKQLEAQKAEIESEVGSALSWELLPEKKLSKISLTRSDTDPKNEADWPSQHEWVTTTLAAFHAAFSKRARLLVGTADSAGDEEVVRQDEPNDD